MHKLISWNFVYPYTDTYIHDLFYMKLEDQVSLCIFVGCEIIWCGNENCPRAKVFVLVADSFPFGKENWQYSTSLQIQETQKCPVHSKKQHTVSKQSLENLRFSIFGLSICQSYWVALLNFSNQPLPQPPNNSSSLARRKLISAKESLM